MPNNVFSTALARNPYPFHSRSSRVRSHWLRAGIAKPLIVALCLIGVPGCSTWSGTVAGVVLTAAGYVNRIYQQHEQERLNQRISEESSIEEIYSAYTNAKAQYDNYQNMYQYTNTPNEGLKTFIEELEEKMPSDITVANFSSTGTQVSFSMRVGSKSAAANTIMQLRTFESLSTVTTTGIDEAEDGTVSLSVLCTYSDPAPLDSSEE